MGRRTTVPRYIDAEGLNLYDDLFMKGKNDSGVWVRYKDVEKLIRKAPTADVEEVKHGEWKHGREVGRRYIGDALVSISYEDFSCSVCGYKINDRHYSQICYRFCPMCGAKMDGKGVDINETMQ